MYATYTDHGDILIGLYPTLEQARAESCGGPVVEVVDAWQHVHREDRTVYFDNRDQSWPELVALLS